MAEERNQFSKRQVTEADDARSLYRKVGSPDENEFTSMLKSNCPVTRDDARRTLVTIYGPDHVAVVLKGKMTRSDAAPRAPTFEAVLILPSIAEHHMDVTLCIDFLSKRLVSSKRFPEALVTARLSPSPIELGRRFVRSSPVPFVCTRPLVSAFATFMLITNSNASVSCSAPWIVLK